MIWLRWPVDKYLYWKPHRIEIRSVDEFED